MREPEDTAGAAAPHLLDGGRNLAPFADTCAVPKEKPSAGTIRKALASEPLHRVRHSLQLGIADDFGLPIILQAGKGQIMCR